MEQEAAQPAAVIIGTFEAWPRGARHCLHDAGPAAQRNRGGAPKMEYRPAKRHQGEKESPAHWNAEKPKAKQPGEVQRRGELSVALKLRKSRNQAVSWTANVYQRDVDER